MKLINESKSTYTTILTNGKQLVVRPKSTSDSFIPTAPILLGLFSSNPEGLFIRLENHLESQIVELNPSLKNYLEGSEPIKSEEVMEELKSEPTAEGEQLDDLIKEKNSEVIEDLTEELVEDSFSIPVTEEVLEMNPDLKDEGVEVGDVIEIPKDGITTDEEVTEEVVDPIEEDQQDGDTTEPDAPSETASSKKKGK